MAEINRTTAKTSPTPLLALLQKKQQQQVAALRKNGTNTTANNRTANNKRQLTKQISDQKTKRHNVNNHNNSSTNAKRSMKNSSNNSSTSNNAVLSTVRNNNGNSTNIINDKSMPSNTNGPSRKKIQFPRSSFFIGSSSIYDSILIDHMPLDSIQQIQLSQTLAVRKVDSNSCFLLREDYTVDSPMRILKELEAIETIVRPYGPILVSMYFKFVHPFYPILHKKVFLEKYDRSYKEVSSPLLSSVYLLALELWDNEPSLIDKPKPNSKLLYQLARNCFADVLQRPKLTAVQAGLLLLQTNQGDERKWILCSQVVSLIEELGLGVDCESWKLPKWEKGLRKRLAWAAFFQDKWISLIESRPSHLIPGVNWLVSELTVEDFTEIENTNELEAGRIFFMELINLSKILSQILNCFYTLANNNLSMSTILQDAKPIQMKLRAWYQSLPDSDRALSSNTSTAPNSNPFLQLAYFIAEITLHRKIISTLHNNRDKLPLELVAVCRNAAKSRSAAAIDFLMQLKSENIHNSFWYSTSSTDIVAIGVFSVILFLTSWSTEEKNYYKDQIFNYRLCLKIISKNFYHAWKALRVFDLIYCQIKELQINDDENDNGGTSDYNQNLKQTASYTNPNFKSNTRNGNNVNMRSNSMNNNVISKKYNNIGDSDSNNNINNNEGSPYSPSNIPIHSNMHATSPFIPYHPSNASSPTTPYNTTTFNNNNQQQLLQQQIHLQQGQHNINSPGSFIANGSSSFLQMQPHGPNSVPPPMSHPGLPPGVVSPSGSMIVPHAHGESNHSGIVSGMPVPALRPMGPHGSHKPHHPQMMMLQSLPRASGPKMIDNGSGKMPNSNAVSANNVNGPGRSMTGSIHGFLSHIMESHEGSTDNTKIKSGTQLQDMKTPLANEGIQQGLTPFDEVDFVDHNMFMLGMNFNSPGEVNISSSNHENMKIKNDNNIRQNELAGDDSMNDNMNNKIDGKQNYGDDSNDSKGEQSK